MNDIGPAQILGTTVERQAVIEAALYRDRELERRIILWLLRRNAMPESEAQALTERLISGNICGSVEQRQRQPGRSKGGVARAAALGPARRSEIAQIAARARWQV